MGIKLEDFIKENKKAFDDDRPSSKLWEKLDQQLTQQQQKKTISLPLWIGIASSFIVLLAIAFLYLKPAQKRDIDLADVSPGYAKKELRFAGLIEEKRDSLQVYAKSNPKLYDKFSADLQKLQTAYDQLKKELTGSPNQQLVVKAMARNLEIQLQVVSQQLSIINEVSQIKKENSI
ncbi:hypothetical protein ACSBL2_26510 [Pedobacter sp. AW31-3R]|uniref:hypothetical protein n=1 Tax=Pedobacter sp. AW31-3R TaxID=3445781 RepID=UPI003FA04469